MDTRTTRRLGSFERAQALTAELFAFNVVLVVRLDGLLASGVLRRALDEVQRRYPLLRARIEGRGRRRRFEVEAPGEVESIPLRNVERSGLDAWQGFVEAELGTGFDTEAGPLARCLRVGGADGSASELVLTFHHMIVDAASVLHVAQEILHLCSPAAPMEVPEPQDLPRSADALFPPAFRAPRRWPASLRFLAAQALDEIAFRWRSRGRPLPSLGGPVQCRILTLALTEEESTAFVRATRRQRVGLYSALSAAMLLAVVRRRYGDQAGFHRYFAFPLLRSYLSPPVAADVVAGYLTTMRKTLRVEPQEGLWHAAATIHQQVDRAVKRGERFLASRWSAASMTMLLRQPTRMGTTALNYAGSAGLEVGAESRFSVEGLHAFVTDFPRGPEYTGQSRIFKGRLWWDIVHLDADMDREEARSVAEEMRRLVIAATAEAMEKP